MSPQDDLHWKVNSLSLGSGERSVFESLRLARETSRQDRLRILQSLNRSRIGGHR